MAKRPRRYFVVDSFAESPLRGNPAAVLLLEEERDERWMKAVAREFNLSATCYVTKIVDGYEDGNGVSCPKYRLRWFAPAVELKICGHGTLAAAYVLFSTGAVQGNTIEFHTLSGARSAERIWIEEDEVEGPNRSNFMVRLGFPLVPVVTCEPDEMELVPNSVVDGGAALSMVKMACEGELIVEYSSGQLVAELHPSIDQIRKWPGRGVVVTGAAPEGSDFDFFTRFFCPNLGMDEDPVCGSIHCGVAPFWSKKFGKTRLKAYMASARGGTLDILVDEEQQKVFLVGNVAPVMEGLLFA